VVDVCVKLQMQSVTTSHEHCTALKLLHLPLSSAAIEQVFSNNGLVQSKLRNELGMKKAAKLVTCYRQLHGTVELDWHLK